MSKGFFAQYLFIFTLTGSVSLIVFYLPSVLSSSNRLNELGLVGDKGHLIGVSFSDNLHWSSNLVEEALGF